MTLKELFQKYVNMSDSERIRHAKSAIASIIDYSERAGVSTDSTTTLLVSYFKLFVSADQRCNYKEKDLFNEVFGLNFSQDEFYEMTNHGADADFIKQMKRITDAMNEDTKYDVIILGLCIVSADDTMTAAEQQLIDYLL